MKKDKALKKTEGLVSNDRILVIRAKVYGDAKLNHQRIANDMWRNNKVWK